MPRSDKRAAEMAAMRRDGMTLAAVGQQYGLSRERVRQILVKAGYDPRRIKRVAALKRDRAHAEALDSELVKHRSAIRSLLLNGEPVSGIAESLGITLAAVQTVNRELGGVSRRTMRSPQGPKYTDLEVLGCLRRANLEIGGVMTGDDYNGVAEGRRFEDGRLWPGKQTAMLRFGSWREALETAGLPQNKSSSVRGRRLFEREHCIDALLEAARALGHLPSYGEYDEYASHMGGILPSRSTIGHRFGSWTSAIRAAAAFNSRMPDE